MPVLELRSLTKRYGATVALREVSLTVEASQVHGLLGPNGSGKTTALACALGLLRPGAGTAHLLGQPAERIAHTMGRVGVVFDSSSLVSGLSVRGNLEYARRLLGHGGGRSPEEALRAVGISDLASRSVGQLSLGQAKRVAVARALLGQPELLVLDEPLSALDTGGVRSMLALIRSLAERGTTLLLSSHRLLEIEEVLTHASILSRGRLVRSGSLAQLAGDESLGLRLEVTPLDQAEQVLARMHGVHSRRLDGKSTLCVRTEGLAAGEINRILVQAGCTVSAIAPERRDLLTLFERLVDGQGEGEGEGEST